MSFGHAPRPQASQATEEQLIACIEESLVLHIPENARFLAERLIAESPSEANKHLLATCYMHCGQHYRAAAALQGVASAPCRYLLALCLMKLPGKLTDAAEALMPGHDPSQVPHGAAGFFQLGRIARLQDRPQEAAGHFSEALALDPLLWQAFEELCALDCGKAEQWLQCGKEPAMAGGAAAPPATPGGFPGFSTGFPPSAQQATPTRDLFGSVPPPGGRYGGPAGGGSPLGGSGGVPFNGLQPGRSAAAAFGQATPYAQQQTPQLMRGVWGGATHGAAGMSAMSLQQPHSQQGFQMADTPGSYRTPPPMVNGSTPPAIGGRHGGGPPAIGSLRLGSMPGSVEAAFGATPTDQGMSGGESAAPGRSSLRTSSLGGAFGGLPADAGKPAKRKVGVGSRLDFAPFSARGRAKGSAAGQPAALDRASHRIGPPQAIVMDERLPDGQALAYGSADGEREVLQLLQGLGSGLRLLSLYRCQDALAAFQQLPPLQRSTAWVWCQVGRAFFEMVDYQQAAHAFEQARRLDTHRLEGMEVYSTVLWHLKREVQAAHLAQQAIALDRLSPHAWCVMGNCFSLHKERENALRFFQRALQVEPTFTYAYTLAGHEYLANEDFEKGLACYQHAVRLDPRHYNAWYGIGQIYFRQEKWQEAHHHFRRAADINKRSSVLHCYTGMALHRQGLHAEALQRLQIAIKVDARNPLARFERAAVLEDQGRLQEALNELAALRELVPREGSVYFKMGRMHRRLNQLDEAVAAFTTALDLKPSSADASTIKSAIEKIRASDEDEEAL